MAPSLAGWRPSRSRSSSVRGEGRRPLDSRWGDDSITAPNGGGWNQLHPVVDPASADNVLNWGSAASTLVNNSPEVGFDEKEDFYKPTLHEPARNAITITIPLPWSRKSARRATSLPRRAMDHQRRQSGEFRIPSVSPEIQATSRLAASTPFAQSEDVRQSPPLNTQFHHQDPDRRVRSPVEIHLAATRRAAIPKHIIHSSALHMLSPVVEDFARNITSVSGSTSPAVAAIETSPPLLPMPFVQNTELLAAGTAPAVNQAPPERVRARSTSRHDSRRRPMERGPGLQHTSYMRSPSVDGQTRQPRVVVEPTLQRYSPDSLAYRPASRSRGSRRAMSSDPVYRRPLTGHDSLDSASSTDVGSEEESELNHRDGDIYYESRKLWNGAAGGGAQGFYNHVVHDYKMIAKDVEADAGYRGRGESLPSRSHEAPARAARDMKVVEVQVIPTTPVLVPEEDELWG